MGLFYSQSYDYDGAMKQAIIHQRIEGAAIFLAALLFYRRGDHSMIWLVVLFFSIDISMLGYLAGPKIGAYAYNTAHNYALPVVLLVLGIHSNVAVALALIWIGHIGFDRAMGYGLKSTSGFGETHLGKIGR